MSELYDKYGNPILEDPWDPEMLQDHVVPNNGTPYSGRSHTVRDRNPNIDESMGMIDILLKQYECIYYVHRTDKDLILMPYLFQMPSQGDKIYNKTTKEVYTIIDVMRNPLNKKWEGIFKIDAIVPPDRDQLQKLQFISRENYVRFTSEHPAHLEKLGQTDDEMIEDAPPIRPTIVHSLMRREPGTANKRPFTSPRIVRPHHVEYLHSRSFPGQSIAMHRAPFDNIVQFDCWSTDNYSADKLVRWFEQFMSLYIPVLRKNGVTDVRLYAYNRDAAVSKWRQDLESRALQYFFRTEEVEAVFEKSIVQLNHIYNLANEIVYDSERWIAGQLVTGQLTQEEYNDLFYDSDGDYLFGSTTINDGNLT